MEGLKVGKEKEERAVRRPPCGPYLSLIGGGVVD